MNPFSMMKDAKNMEKMMKPALEKFMKEAGFIKKEDFIDALDDYQKRDRRFGKIN